MSVCSAFWWLPTVRVRRVEGTARLNKRILSHHVGRQARPRPRTCSLGQSTTAAEERLQQSCRGKVGGTPPRGLQAWRGAVGGRISSRKSAVLKLSCCQPSQTQQNRKHQVCQLMGPAPEPPPSVSVSCNLWDSENHALCGVPVCQPHVDFCISLRH